MSGAALKSGLAGAAAAVSVEQVGRAILDMANGYAEAAKAAGDLANATGGTVEQVSRMQAALRDAGITTEQSANMLTKFATAAGTVKGADALRALNVELVRGRDGAVDYAATMTVAVDQIMLLGDAAQRNTALVALFGRQGAKAFQDMLASGQSLSEVMAAISEARLFTDQDVANGRALDNAMDDLNASAEQLTNTVGRGVVPAMVLLADTFGAVSDSAADFAATPLILTTAMSPLTGVLSGYAQMLGVTADETERLGDATLAPKTNMEALTAAIADGVTSGQAFADAVRAAGDELAEQDANARLAAQALDIYRASTDQAYESTLKLLGLDRSERSAQRAAEGAADQAGDAKARLDETLATANKAKTVVEKIAAIRGRERRKDEQEGIVKGSVDVRTIEAIKGRKAQTKTRVIEAAGVITPAEARQIRAATREYEESLDDISEAWIRLGQARVAHSEALGITMTEAEKLDEVRKALREGLQVPGLSPQAKKDIEADLKVVEAKIKALGGVPIEIEGIKFKPGTTKAEVEKLQASIAAALRGSTERPLGENAQAQLDSLKVPGVTDLKVTLGLDPASVAASQAALANVGVDPKTGRPYEAKTVAKVDKTQAQKDLDALTKDREMTVKVNLVPGDTGGGLYQPPMTVPGGRAARLNFGGGGQVVQFSPTIISNYPKPERTSDSIASALRTAKYAVGL